MIVIAGKVGDLPVKTVFQVNLVNKRVEKLPEIGKARSSFAAHYDFQDRFIYVIGGCCGKNGETMKDCEMFDVYNCKWSKMPSLI